MIHYVVRRRHRYTIDLFLATYGRDLAFELRVRPWEEVLRARRLAGGTWILTDLDRLAPPERERATAVAEALAHAGARVLNHPTRSRLRYELLRELYEAGLNDFDAVRLDEGRPPKRWPVFLRREDGHEGAVSELLATPAELAEAVAGLEARGVGRGDLLAVEFAGAPDPDGLHRKYGAFRVGDRILPRHLFFDRAWQVKGPKVDDAARIAAELAFVRESPHAEALREIFERAHIEYGRVDYGVRDGRVQVWEINTNPMTVGDEGGPLHGVEVQALFSAAFRDALAAIDTPGGDQIAIPAPTRPARWRERGFAVLGALGPRATMAAYRARWAWLRRRSRRS